MAATTRKDLFSILTQRWVVFCYNLLVLLLLAVILYSFIYSTTTTSTTPATTPTPTPGTSSTPGATPVAGTTTTTNSTGTTTTTVSAQGTVTETRSHGFFFKHIPASLYIAGYAVWFGALGGLVISLKGVYDHWTDWMPSLALWHYGRPFSAAIAGGVTYVLLLAVNPDSHPSTAVLEAAAFILGTQEKRFFNFLSQVATLVVAVPDQEDALSLAGVQPDRGGPDTDVKLTGTGFKAGARVSIGNGSLRDTVIGGEGKEITGRLVIDPVTAETKVDVRVENSDGRAYVLREHFTVLPPQAQPPAGAGAAAPGTAPPPTANPGGL